MKGGARKGAGRKKGGKNVKTEQWEKLGDAITSQHCERFNEILANSDDEKFANLYLQTLEYFKPKRSRQDLTANVNQQQIIIIDSPDE